MPELIVPRTQRPVLVYIILMVLMSMMATACGTKPASLSPPPGAEDTPFPRTYPDPATDPGASIN